MRSFLHLAGRPLIFLNRWLLPVGALLTMTGYFRPWISHKAAGLAILGLDLGELVKFLHPVQQGDIRLWREGFYLPLVAVSVSLSLSAFRRDLADPLAGSSANSGGDGEGSRSTYGWPVRIGLLLLAIVAALNLLPPAWTPGLLLQPEYRLQTMALLLCLALVALSPLAALLMVPRSLLQTFYGTEVDRNRRGCLGRAAWSIAVARTIFPVALAGAALYFPLAQFIRILPTLAELYGQVPEIGLGPALMTIGLTGLLLHGLSDISNLMRE
jgi:hypothetical protein